VAWAAVPRTIPHSGAGRSSRPTSFWCWRRRRRKRP